MKQCPLLGYKYKVQLLLSVYNIPLNLFLQ